MKKYIALSLIVFPFLLGCLNLLGGDPDKEENGTIEVTIKSNTSEIYNVSILNKYKDIISQKTGIRGNKAIFYEVTPGKYFLQVKGLDSGENIIEEGMKEVTVNSGEKVMFEITLQNVSPTSDKGQILVSFSYTDEKSKADSYKVTLLNESKETILTKEGSLNDEIPIQDLEPATYIVKVEGFDLEGSTVLTGEQSVEVLSDSTKKVLVPLTSTTGSITITLPK